MLVTYSHYRNSQGQELQISDQTVWKILWKQSKTIAYKLHLLPNLRDEDKMRYNFCWEMLKNYEDGFKKCLIYKSALSSSDKLWYDNILLGQKPVHRKCI